MIYWVWFLSCTGFLHTAFLLDLVGLDSTALMACCSQPLNLFATVSARLRVLALADKSADALFLCQGRSLRIFSLGVALFLVIFADDLRGPLKRIVLTFGRTLGLKCLLCCRSL